MNNYVYRLWDKKKKEYICGSYWGGGRHTYMTLGATKGVRNRLFPHGAKHIEIHEFELVRTSACL
ncbi:unnamed protein product [marine sediment metagenome]|uniref:Uncharacterized protein n=1 Tax=marine sediment metagenome TaxID=412755 RepID=X0ZDG3_9ZZZZ